MSDQGGMGSTSNQARKAEATLTHPSARDRGTLLTVSPQDTLRPPYAAPPSLAGHPSAR